MSARHLNSVRLAAVADDEFYTPFDYVEENMRPYHDLLRDKRVYCNCDHRDTSAFVQYLEREFDNIGLRSLTATIKNMEPVFFNAPRGYSYQRDRYKGERTDFPSGDGSYASGECLDILRASDVVITNPPFSLLRRFIDTVLLLGKDFILLGPITVVSSKVVFSGIMEGRVYAYGAKSGSFIRPDGTRKGAPCGWYSTIAPPPPLCTPLAPAPDVEASGALLDSPFEGESVMNIDALVDIPAPSAYRGILAVPITYLHNHNPALFRILGIKSGETGPYHHPTATINGVNKYNRVLIRAR